MSNQILSIIVLGLLLLFILSPFSALALLMVTLFAAVVFWMVSSLVQAVLSNSGE